MSNTDLFETGKKPGLESVLLTAPPRQNAQAPQPPNRKNALTAAILANISRDRREIRFAYH